MSCLSTAEWSRGPFRGRPNVLARAGDVTHGHAHNFDHLTIVLRGAVRIVATLPDGTVVDREYRELCLPPLILAGVEHEITALEDNTAYLCLYVHRDADGAIVAEHQGVEGAYC